MREDKGSRDVPGGDLLCLRQVNQCDRENVSTIQVLVSLILYYIIVSCCLKITMNSQISVTFGSDIVFFASAFEQYSTDG
jgi:hypothetical protein